MNLSKKLLFLGCLFFSTVTYSQEIIRFNVSKTYCLINFMQTASGASGTSPSLKKIITAQAYDADSSFARLISEYGAIRLNYSFRRDEIPASRHQNRSTYDIICNAAVKSSGLDDLRERISGLLPNESLEKFLSVLKKAEPVYDRLIWNDSYGKLLEEADQLRSFSGTTKNIFEKLKIFYGTSWDPGFPFIVSLFPIPGKNVTTTATPHGNSLCIGIPTDEPDHLRRLGVIIHEICHVLYDEESPVLQKKLDHYLSSIVSPYQPLAGHYLDEAMATACGNGWAKSILAAKTDSGKWYNNIYIDSLAHGLYPMVVSYINGGKQIDSSFISTAVEIFSNRFPKAIYDYNILLNNITVYSDAETESERKAVMNSLYRNFTISSSNLSSPVLHELSLKTLRTSSTTQFVIIDRDQEKTIEEIANVFPELKSILENRHDENFVVSFYDHIQRPVIIVRLKDISVFDKVLAQLKQVKYFSAEQPYKVVE